MLESFLFDYSHIDRRDPVADRAPTSVFLRLYVLIAILTFVKVLISVLDELLSRISFDLGLFPDIFHSGVAIGAHLVIFD